MKSMSDHEDDRLALVGDQYRRSKICELKLIFGIEEPYESCGGGVGYTIQTVDQDGDADGGIIAEFDTFEKAIEGLNTFCTAVVDNFNITPKEQE